MMTESSRGFPRTAFALAAIICIACMVAFSLSRATLESARAAPAASGPAAQSQPAGMTLTTPAFKSGDPIPKKHASAGENASPALNWLKPPAGTKEFALIMEDSTNSHVHWVIYKIPAATTGLKEAMPGPAKLTEPAGAIQGKGYSGPGPGPGPAHKYVFTLYALDAALDLKPGLNKKPLEEAMKGHILATAQLIGTYQRPS